MGFKTKIILVAEPKENIEEILPGNPDNPREKECYFRKKPRRQYYRTLPLLVDDDEVKQNFDANRLHFLSIILYIPYYINWTEPLWDKMDRILKNTNRPYFKHCAACGVLTGVLKESLTRCSLCCLPFHNSCLARKFNEKEIKGFYACHCCIDYYFVLQQIMVKCSENYKEKMRVIDKRFRSDFNYVRGNQETISYERFHDYYFPSHVDQKFTRMLFVAFDVDKDGFLSYKEYRQIESVRLIKEAYKISNGEALIPALNYAEIRILIDEFMEAIKLQKRFPTTAKIRTYKLSSKIVKKYLLTKIKKFAPAEESEELLAFGFDRLMESSIEDELGMPFERFVGMFSICLIMRRMKYLK